MHVLELETSKGVTLTDTTERVAQLVTESGITSGLCNLFIPHSTAAITINSAIDDETPTDIINELNRMVPMRVDFIHQFDSPSDAAGHIKASLVGPSITIPVNGGKLALGFSQAILFCDFDGPRHRKLYVMLAPLTDPAESTTSLVEDAGRGK